MNESTPLDRMQSSSTDQQLSKETQQRLLEAEVELKKQKADWLRHRILLTTLEKVLENSRIEGDADLSEFGRRLIEAESDFCDGISSTVLAMKAGGGNIESEQNNILKKLEKELQNTCRDLMSYHVDINLENSAASSSNSMKLETLLKDQKTHLESCQTQLSSVRKSESQLFASSLKELLESSKILTKILEKYRIALQPQKDEVVFENLLSRCDALHYKLRAMSTKLRYELYTSDDVAALQSVRSALLEAKKQKKQETITAQEKIRTFRIIGDDFNKLVSEYSQLQVDIEKQTWCLEQLNHG